MKTVRPLGLVMLGCVVSFALSGCGSVFKVNPAATVVFSESGVPVQLTPMEYGVLRGELRALLAEKNFELVDSMRDTPQAIARVELETTGTAPNRKVVAMKIARVGPISTTRGTGSREVAPHTAHPSLDLARSLDLVRSAGDTTSGR